MVTIPPAVWTNAAHRHGVLVLGEQKADVSKNLSSLPMCIHSPSLFV